MNAISRWNLNCWKRKEQKKKPVFRFHQTSVTCSQKYFRNFKLCALFIKSSNFGTVRRKQLKKKKQKTGTQYQLTVNGYYRTVTNNFTVFKTTNLYALFIGFDAFIVVQILLFVKSLLIIASFSSVYFLAITNLFFCFLFFGIVCAKNWSLSLNW